MDYFPEPETAPDGANITFDPATLEVQTEDEGPLEAGDELAVFDSDGTCVGGILYDGSGEAQAMAVAALVPPATFGLEPGEAFDLRFWDTSVQAEYSPNFSFTPCEADELLCEDENSFVTGGLYELATLDTTPPVPSDQLELIDVSPRSAIGLIWSAVVPEDAMEFEVLRRTAGAAEWTIIKTLDPGTATGGPRRMEYLDAQAPMEQLEYAIELVRADNPSIITDPFVIDNTGAGPGGTLALRRIVQVSPTTSQVITVRLWGQDSQLVSVLFEDVVDVADTPVNVLIPTELAAGQYLIEATGPAYRKSLIYTVEAD